MITRFICSALTLAVLAACSAEGIDTSVTETGTDATQTAVETAATGEDGPVQDLESSNRLATAGAAANDATNRGLREIGWEELMPEGEEERLAELYQEQMAMLYSGAPVSEGSAADQMIQIGTFNIVPELNDLKVRIPGYTVPFDFGADAEITEFLLVPYYGACLHAPPPPPNQTIFVQTDEPIKLKDLAQAVWIEGTLHTQVQTSDLADAAYTIKLDRMTVYEY